MVAWPDDMSGKLRGCGVANTCDGSPSAWQGSGVRQRANARMMALPTCVWVSARDRLNRKLEKTGMKDGYVEESFQSTENKWMGR